MQSLLFSRLDEDEKTYNHFLYYIENAEKLSFVCLDNNIQLLELKKHCNYYHDDSQEQQITWINEHGQEMRHYLNSLKILYMLYKESDIVEDTSFDSFKILVQKINSDYKMLSSISN